MLKVNRLAIGTLATLALVVGLVVFSWPEQAPTDGLALAPHPVHASGQTASGDLPGAFKPELVRESTLEAIHLEEQRQVLASRSSSAQAKLFGRTTKRGRPYAGLSVVLTYIQTQASILKLGRSSPTRFKRNSDKNGRFRFESLKPGSYLVAYSEKTFKHLRTASIELAAGESLNLGDVAMDWATDEYLAQNSERLEPARIHISSNRPRTPVIAVTDNSFEPGTRSLSAKTVGYTDRNGGLAFDWVGTKPIRIDLLDAKSRVLLGSTESYAHYPNGQETSVTISASSGGLLITLQQSAAPQAGQIVQYSLVNTDYADAKAIVESVNGDHPVRTSPGIATSANCIEFEALRPGTYNVQVGRMSKINGRWIPLGTKLFDRAAIKPGLVARIDF
ncbi:MAG: hypothetical protein ACI8X5_001727 [Planctomycetota bacterium]|jgi:hypothetical protein